MRARIAELETQHAALETEHATLRSEHSTLRSEHSTLRSEHTRLQSRCATLHSQVLLLRKMLFGRKSERRIDEVRAEPNPQQGWLWAAEAAARVEESCEETGAEGEVSAEAGDPTRRKPKRRKKFPEHLPRFRSVFTIPEEERQCCGEAMAEIGTEVRRELERLEVSYVHEILRKKYACRHCQEGVRIAPGPPAVIEKGLLGAGFLAHVLSERFGNHQPYHRQEKKYAAEGLDLSRAVLCQSSLRCAELLEPIWKQVADEVRASPVIHTDETPVDLQESSTGGCRKARVWVYRDLEGRTVFDFTETRSRDGPGTFLAGYRGYVQADAASTFDLLYGPGKATEVGCWAHARRYFVRAQDSDAELSGQAIDQIRVLFRIEREAKALPPEERRRLRQERAVPRLEAFRAWLDMVQMQVLPKSPMGRAIQYCVNHWEALTRYVEDGRLSIDNNAAERALRAVAVGRKNWMVVGNPRGGRAAAILYSLVMTCKEIGVDPAEYFRDVLVRLSHCSDVRLLTPHGWKEHFAPRLKERRDRILARLREASVVERAAAAHA